MTLTYNDGLLKTLVNKNAEGVVIDTYKYTYDGAHNQDTKEEYINGKNKGTTKYTYDAAGNRRTETVIQGEQTVTSIYDYNEQNRLQVVKEITGEYVEGETIDEQRIVQVITFGYDNNGNQIEVTTIQYQNGIAQAPETTINEYDEFNQLIRTISGGRIVENYYNGEGLREAKVVDGVLTRYLYEYDKVVLEVDAEGNQTGRNIYGTNLLMRTVEGESYYYLYNGHADVVALVNTQTGSIDATYYYDAFGNILESDGIAKDKNSILYAGYQYDEETGLYYLNARMYDPKIARFLQEDTYTGDPNDPLSLNLYTYSHNNPIIYYDPTGHAINLVSGAIGAGIGFLLGAGSSIITDAIKGEFSGKNWKKYLGSGVQGAIVGGAAGLTVGGSLVATAAIGAAAGAVGNVANQTIRNDGFKDFSVKELAVSTIASGVGAGVAGAVSKAATNLTAQISSQALQKTAQGAAIGAASGSTGSFAASVTDQVWDITTGEKESFDIGSLVRDTFVGGVMGAGIGGVMGYANSKYGAKVSELDAKVNNSIKEAANKFIQSSKLLINKVITDETGSVRITPPSKTNKNVNAAVGEVKTGIVNGKTPASRLADKVQSLSNSKRPNTVAVIRSKDGKYIVGRNSGGIMNETVSKILDELGNVNMYNRKCAEVNAISRAMNKGIDLEGATISVSYVTNVTNKSGLHGQPKPPCNVCQPLLDYLKMILIKS
ncbi:RHS repeat-associated core domain-containing protein [Acetivibrio clariflavus]|uniref:RHS repeat-associated core domain-containing protein n=1 Tax=Acetivibrio clariflavus TaxID=288965 RepID=UPI0031F4DD17